MELKKWLEDLENKILENDDKVLFKEASGCLEHNFFRAAYILGWIALIESLKRKINRFANIGDKKSDKAVEKIEGAEKNKQSADIIIFQEANSCAVIDPNDLNTIQYLWGQRCIFAHPYEIEPDIDDVKYILNQIVKISLGKELLFNKSYISELCNNIAEKPFFLPKNGVQVRDYANKTISRVPENLYPFFFKTLLSKIGTIKDDDTKVYEITKLRNFIVELFSRTNVDLNSTDFGLEKRAADFPFESFIGYVHIDTWEKIPYRIKEMLIAFMEGLTNSTQLEFIKLTTSALVKRAILEDEFKERFFVKLNSLPIETSIWHYSETLAKYNRIISDMKTFSYDIQNPVIDVLKTDQAIDFLKSLDFEQRFEIGRVLVYAANNSHYKSQNFIPSILSENSEYQDEIKAGIAFGYIFSANNSFRYRIYDLIKTINILNEIDESICNTTYEKMIDLLNHFAADDFDRLLYSEEDFNSWVKKIEDEIEWNSNNKRNFDSFKERIRSFYED